MSVTLTNRVGHSRVDRHDGQKLYLVEARAIIGCADCTKCEACTKHETGLAVVAARSSSHAKGVAEGSSDEIAGHEFYLDRLRSIEFVVIREVLSLEDLPDGWTEESLPWEPKHEDGGWNYTDDSIARYLNPCHDCKAEIFVGEEFVLCATCDGSGINGSGFHDDEVLE